MPWPRRLLPPAAGLLILAGCGGSAHDANPAPPAAAHLDPQFAARSGSAGHIALSWNDNRAGTTWRLERRRDGDGRGYRFVAEIDSTTRHWLDSGLSPGAAYSYRLRRADGTVLATAAARAAMPSTTGRAVGQPVAPITRQLRLTDDSLSLADAVSPHLASLHETGSVDLGEHLGSQGGLQ